MTSYPAAGQFSVTVRATDGAGRAAVITRPMEGREACCGSRVPLSQDNLAPTGVFSRAAETVSVEVSEVDIQVR